MAPPLSPQPPWRTRWAERENARRRHAYDVAAETWRRHDDHLVRLRIEAAGFLGCTQPRAGLPVDLDDDEVVYRVLPVADLVEVEGRHLTGLPVPGLTVVTAGVGAHALPAGVRAVDTGMAVVTNHRIAFSSRRERHEWRYAEMSGPAHHPAVPLTLLHTTDGRRLTGLRVPAAATVNFRFYLTLAFASAVGQRACVAGQLDTLLAAHRSARPVPPSPVEPDHAPSARLRADRRVALAAAVAVALAATAIGPQRADPPHRAGGGGPGAAATPAPAGTTAPVAFGEPVAWETDPALSGPDVPAGHTDPGTTRERAPTRVSRAESPGGPAPSALPVTLPSRSGGPAPTATGAPATEPVPGTVPSTEAVPGTEPAPVPEPVPSESPTVDLCTAVGWLPVVRLLVCPPGDS
ncbi:hypothetical protein [Micromonospora sp. NPDC047074]|uniref:hypothetical protein n=1 Tax=Micromonospora sp. NPDC047074 TaxID=3154339 RepID=UPI0033C12014